MSKGNTFFLCKDPKCSSVARPVLEPATSAQPPALSQVAVLSNEIGDSSVYSRFQAFRFKIVGTPQRCDNGGKKKGVTRTLTKFPTSISEHRPATGWQVLKRRWC